MSVDEKGAFKRARIKRLNLIRACINNDPMPIQRYKTQEKAKFNVPMNNAILLPKLEFVSNI